MGIFNRLFGRKQRTAPSLEDRLAEASLNEHKAFKAAQQAESALNTAVDAYKDAKKRGASNVELMGLRDRVERANDTYDARVQMLRNCSTNVSLVSQVENNELLKAAAAITVSDTELEDTTKEAVLRIEEQRQAKLQAEAHKNVLKEVYEVKSRDVNALLDEDEEDTETSVVREKEKDVLDTGTLE